MTASLLDRDEKISDVKMISKKLPYNL